MSLEDYMKEKLWPILVETVHGMIMYQNHKAYTRDNILHDKPEITATDLAIRLRMPLGEALVILFELSQEIKPKETE